MASSSFAVSALTNDSLKTKSVLAQILTGIHEMQPIAASSDGDILVILKDFLQKLLAHTDSSQALPVSSEPLSVLVQTEQIHTVSLDVSLETIWYEYQQSYPNDKYGQVVLAMAARPDFPKDANWSALFNLLRGAHQVETKPQAVKIQAYLCYEARDMRITPEVLSTLLWQLVKDAQEPNAYLKAILTFVKGLLPQEEAEAFIKHSLGESKVVGTDVYPTLVDGIEHQLVSPHYSKPLGDSEISQLPYLLISDLATHGLNLTERNSSEQAGAEKRAMYAEAKAYYIEECNRLGLTETSIQENILSGVTLSMANARLLSPIEDKLFKAFLCLSEPTKTQLIRHLISFKIPFELKSIDKFMKSLFSIEDNDGIFQVFCMDLLYRYHDKGIISAEQDKFYLNAIIMRTRPPNLLGLENLSTRKQRKARDAMRHALFQVVAQVKNYKNISIDFTYLYFISSIVTSDNDKFIKLLSPQNKGSYYFTSRQLMLAAEIAIKDEDDELVKLLSPQDKSTDHFISSQLIQAAEIAIVKNSTYALHLLFLAGTDFRSLYDKVEEITQYMGIILLTTRYVDYQGLLASHDIEDNDELRQHFGHYIYLSVFKRSAVDQKKSIESLIDFAKFKNDEKYNILTIQFLLRLPTPDTWLIIKNNFDEVLMLPIICNDVSSNHYNVIYKLSCMRLEKDTLRHLFLSKKLEFSKLIELMRGYIDFKNKKLISLYAVYEKSLKQCGLENDSELRYEFVPYIDGLVENDDKIYDFSMIDFAVSKKNNNYLFITVMLLITQCYFLKGENTGDKVFDDMFLALAEKKDTETLASVVEALITCDDTDAQNIAIIGLTHALSQATDKIEETKEGHDILRKLLQAMARTPTLKSAVGTIISQALLLTSKINLNAVATLLVIASKELIPSALSYDRAQPFGVEDNLFMFKEVYKILETVKSYALAETDIEVIEALYRFKLVELSSLPCHISTWIDPMPNDEASLPTSESPSLSQSAFAMYGASASSSLSSSSSSSIPSASLASSASSSGNVGKKS